MAPEEPMTYYKCIICGDDMLLPVDLERAAEMLFEWLSKTTLDDCRKWIKEHA